MDSIQHSTAVNETVEAFPRGAAEPAGTARRWCRGELVAQVFLAASDMAVLGSASAAFLWPSLDVAGGAREAASIALLAAVAVAGPVLLFAVLGIYRCALASSRCGLLEQAVGAAAGLAVVGAALWITTGSVDWSTPQARPAVGAWFLAATAGMLALRAIVTGAMRRWARAGLFERWTVIVGTEETAAALIERLASATGGNGVRLMGVFLVPGGALPHSVRGVPVLGVVGGLADGVRRTRVDEVIIALPWSDGAQLAAVIAAARRLPVDVHVVPAASGLPELDMAGDTAGPDGGELRLLPVARRPLAGWNGVLKRAEDLVIASIVLVLTAPLILGIAVAIKATSSGPVLFQQKRFGFNNRVFQVWKFRTMYTDRGDPSGERRTVRNDPRVTPVGAWLRRLSLDELPQLLNVLRGDMSLVGPRAHAVAMKIGPVPYGEAVAEYDARHRIAPGITGWAQINGARGEVKELDGARRRVQLDLRYIEEWSLSLDLVILVRTAAHLLHDDNAY